MIDLTDESIPCTMDTLSSRLLENPEFGHACGEEYLAGLLLMAEPDTVVSSAKKVVEARSMRRLRDMGMSLIREIEEGGEDSSTIADRILWAIVDEAGDRLRPSFYPISTVLEGVSSDSIRHSWQYDVGEPSEWETALRFVHHAVFDLEEPVLIAIFSQGIRKEEVALRITDHLAGIPVELFLSAAEEPVEEAIKKLKEASNLLSEAENSYLWQENGVSPAEIMGDFRFGQFSKCMI